MAQDAEYRNHRETWDNFRRLMTMTVIAVVVILASMAKFLT
jgi:hypothetical protein